MSDDDWGALHCIPWDMVTVLIPRHRRAFQAVRVDARRTRDRAQARRAE